MNDQREMAEMMAGVFQENGDHVVFTEDVLDVLATCGFRLAEDNLGVASLAYYEAIKAKLES